MHQIVCLAALIAASLASCAHAADAVPQESTLTVGAGIAYVPEYAGAKKSRAMGLVDVEYANKNGLFAGGREGIGYRTALGPVNVSAAVGYSSGRHDRDSRRRFGSVALKGMGEIKGSAVLNLGVGYDLGGMSVGLKAKLAREEHGNSVELAAGMPLFSDDADSVSLFGSIGYGDRKHAQTWYGVTAEQSLRSGFKQYSAKAGLESAALGGVWNHKFNKNWSVRTMAGAFTLLDVAADSPLTKRKTAPVVLTTVNYSF